MVRVRVPGGQTTGPALAALGRAAARHGRGLLQLTSRAGLQVRGLPEDLPDAVRGRGRGGGLPALGDARAGPQRRRLPAHRAARRAGRPAPAGRAPSTPPCRPTPPWPGCPAGSSSGSTTAAATSPPWSPTSPTAPSGPGTACSSSAPTAAGSSPSTTPSPPCWPWPATSTPPARPAGCGGSASCRPGWTAWPGSRPVDAPVAPEPPLGVVGAHAVVGVPLGFLDPGPAGRRRRRGRGRRRRRHAVAQPGGRRRRPTGWPTLTAAGLVADPTSPWTALSACVGAPWCASGPGGHPGSWCARSRTRTGAGRGPTSAAASGAAAPRPARTATSSRRPGTRCSPWPPPAGGPCLRPRCPSAAPPARRYDYVTDPAEIYRRSFAQVRAEADLSGLPEDARTVAVRMIHASGDLELPALARRCTRGWSPRPAGRWRAARRSSPTPT